MPFFCPYDNVEKKFFISNDVLDKYPNNIFSVFDVIKDQDNSIDIYKDAIILHEIDNDMLKLIIKLMINDFNIDVINQYCNCNCSCNVNISLSKIQEHSGKLIKKINMDLYFMYYIDEKQRCILNELLQILKKYNIPTDLKYKIKKSTNVEIMIPMNGHTNNPENICNEEEIKILKNFDLVEELNFNLENIILSKNNHRNGILYQYKMCIEINKNPKFTMLNDDKSQNFLEKIKKNLVKNFNKKINSEEYFGDNRNDDIKLEFYCENDVKEFLKD
jgi:hypothetical protein